MATRFGTIADSNLRSSSTADLVLTSTTQQVMLVLLTTGSWLIESVLRYKVSDTSMNVGFIGPGVTDRYTFVYTEGTLFYDRARAKLVDCDASQGYTLLSTTTDDGGPSVSIAAPNTAYTVISRTLVLDVAAEATAGFGLSASATGGGTATVLAGATVVAHRLTQATP